MQIEIVKVLSGDQATFYSVKLDGEDITLFDKYLIEYQKTYHEEVGKISRNIRAMANNTGARENFFKLKEGVPGDGVCALYDDPEKNLRLYCIRYGTVAVILGSGGEKPKDIRALQESPKLTLENQLVRDISAAISQAMRDKLIWWSGNGMELLSHNDSMIIEF